ncbi:hypothetical protein [Bordetella genomosp. 9]|nr:hypothetical protein [Bordetella genomosp. 9]
MLEKEVKSLRHQWGNDELRRNSLPIARNGFVQPTLKTGKES